MGDCQAKLISKKQKDQPIENGETPGGYTTKKIEIKRTTNLFIPSSCPIDNE